MKRKSLSLSDLNQLRHHAQRLLEAGVRQADIARRLGVSRGCVCRWAREWDKRGRLRPLANLGRPRRLSKQQAAIVRTAMRRGPRAHGLGSDSWTGSNIAALIEAQTGEVLGPDLARRLFSELAGDRWRGQPRLRRRRGRHRSG